MAIIDARDLPEGSEIEADLVIIGGGIAGIAIATEWAGANKKVVVLESGGRDADETTQALYRGVGVMRGPDNSDVTIDNYLWQSRFRGLGGSGNIWGGKCVPLDEADFAARDWLQRTGWPMSRADMQPFYDRACDVLQVPHFERDYSQPQEEGRPPLPVHGELFSAPRCFSRVSGRADPERFNIFRTAFAEAENIDVYLNANVTEIRRHRGGGAIRELEIACLNGRSHRARGRTYVLATGGIENVRLLLASDLGGENGLLGRCFMGHVTIGAFEEGAPMSVLSVSDASQPMSLYTDNAPDKVHCVLAASLDGQRRFRTGNFTITMADAENPPPADVQAVLALSAAIDRSSVRALGARPLPFFLMSEQLPNLESRITLDPENRDALGVPRVKLEWVYSRRDFDNIEAAIAGIAATLGGQNVGRLCWPVARDGLLAAFSPSRHHMGTTRMSVDPENGVVDAYGRMHGLSNLYVAGSSVFPTAGIANPTLTLVALALRMSDHLKRELGVRS